MGIMRSFKHFPDIKTCPICGTNEDKECFLVPIDGTEDGNNCEAQPFHVDCLTNYADRFRYHSEMNFLYMGTK